MAAVDTPTSEELSGLYSETRNVMQQYFTDADFNYPFNLMMASAAKLVGVLGKNVYNGLLVSRKSGILRAQVGVVQSRDFIKLFDNYMLPSVIKSVPDMATSGRSIYMYPRSIASNEQLSFISNMIPTTELERDVVLNSSIHYKFSDTSHMFRLPLCRLYNNVNKVYLMQVSMLLVLENGKVGQPLHTVNVNDFRNFDKVIGLSAKMVHFTGNEYKTIFKVTTNNVIGFDEISPINRALHSGHKLFLELDNTYTNPRYL